MRDMVAMIAQFPRSKTSAHFRTSKTPWLCTFVRTMLVETDHDRYDEEQTDARHHHEESNSAVTIL